MMPGCLSDHLAGNWSYSRLYIPKAPWLQAYGDAATTGSWEQAGATFLLLLLYGAAVIPLVYLYSFGFSAPSACQVRFSCCKDKGAFRQLHLCAEHLL